MEPKFFICFGSGSGEYSVCLSILSVSGEYFCLLNVSRAACVTLDPFHVDCAARVKDGGNPGRPAPMDRSSAGNGAAAPAKQPRVRPAKQPRDGIFRKKLSVHPQQLLP